MANNLTLPIDSRFIRPRNCFNSAIAEQMRCGIENGPLGQIVKVDESQMTTAPNVYAAGDNTRVAHNVTFACADGVMATMAIHRWLVFERTAA